MKKHDDENKTPQTKKTSEQKNADKKTTNNYENDRASVLVYTEERPEYS